MRQYTVVYGNRTTEAQRHRGRQPFEGFREKRGLSGSAVNSERGKHEAVHGGVRE